MGAGGAELPWGSYSVPRANKQGGLWVWDLSLLPSRSLRPFTALPPTPGPIQLPFCLQHAPDPAWVQFCRAFQS